MADYYYLDRHNYLLMYVDTRSTGYGYIGHIISITEINFFAYPDQWDAHWVAWKTNQLTFTGQRVLRDRLKEYFKEKYPDLRYYFRKINDQFKHTAFKSDIPFYAKNRVSVGEEISNQKRVWDLVKKFQKDQQQSFDPYNCTIADIKKMLQASSKHSMQPNAWFRPNDLIKYNKAFKDVLNSLWQKGDLNRSVNGSGTGYAYQVKDFMIKDQKAFPAEDMEIFLSDSDDTKITLTKETKLVFKKMFGDNYCFQIYRLDGSCVKKGIVLSIDDFIPQGYEKPELPASMQFRFNVEKSKYPHRAHF